MAHNHQYFHSEKLHDSEFVTALDTRIPIDDQFGARITDPAKEFAFRLDAFQMQAIIKLEEKCNVFVAAHTSAGKTVVAEYAIAMAFRAKSKVVYTSPIKALSNQKYRDFKNEFNDVGLITGDVQINASASCLIMTTEILLQMLYNSSELIGELDWVIFDEVHYVNDPERGHVWEEVFILLPKNVNLVLLSATVPNVIQFADWLGRTRKKKTYVVSTYRRPVPLEHFFYLGRDGKSQNQRFLILDRDGVFKKDGYDKSNDIVKERGFQKKHPQTERNIYINLIRHLEKNDKLPAICFTLSRNRCDSNLEMLMSINKDSFNLTTRDESARIHRFIMRTIRRLKDVDQKLPQILTVVEMLKRGLGVHHSGILPILKEITEILFCDGLVKVLFATETFAMGVNMPARTVVFDSIMKHDGNKFRDLKASEYIQMAGRAGRRGKDATGTVIILCKYGIPEPHSLLKIMTGSASELVSQFRLTYHMILNLHRQPEGKEIENFLEQSFGEYGKVKKSVDHNIELKCLKDKVDVYPSLDCDICSSDIERFCHAFNDYLSIAAEVMPQICVRALQNKFLNSGRILAIGDKTNPFQTAVLLRVNRDNNEIADLLVLKLNNKTNQYEIAKIELKSIHRILSSQIKNINVNDVMSEHEKKHRKDDDKLETKRAIDKLETLSLQNNYRIFEMPFVDPDKNLQLRELNIAEKLAKFNSQRNLLLKFDCIKCTLFTNHFELMSEKVKLIAELGEVEYKLSSKSLQLLPEYFDRIKVLQTRDYLDKHERLQLKGKVACLMSEHELVITEMLVNNVLGDMTNEEIAGLLSCFVFQQKVNLEPKLTDSLQRKKEELIVIARKIGESQKACGIDYEPIEWFVDQLKFGLVQVVYEWAKGLPFVDIIEMTDVQEGIIVRCIQRLDELLKFVKLAAKVIGNSELETKIELASQSIKRDIVFSASLYTINDNENDEQNNSVDDDENLSSNFL